MDKPLASQSGIDFRLTGRPCRALGRKRSLEPIDKGSSDKSSHTTLKRTNVSIRKQDRNMQLLDIIRKIICKGNS